MPDEFNLKLQTKFAFKKMFYICDIIMLFEIQN
jgi:hypothetical protein